MNIGYPHVLETAHVDAVDVDTQPEVIWKFTEIWPFSRGMTVAPYSGVGKRNAPGSPLRRFQPEHPPRQ